MTKLKLGPIADDRPVKVSVELPAAVHRDLVAYATVYSRSTGREVTDPAKLIAPMLEKFMATDRAFTKARRAAHGSDRVVSSERSGLLPHDNEDRALPQAAALVPDPRS